MPCPRGCLIEDWGKCGQELNGLGDAPVGGRGADPEPGRELGIRVQVCSTASAALRAKAAEAAARAENIGPCGLGREVGEGALDDPEQLTGRVCVELQTLTDLVRNLSLRRPIGIELQKPFSIYDEGSIATYDWAMHSLGI
ncbi:hypothetical protein GCM10010240_40510 [Streptomyces griseoviridis]|nr:hypothetical protein GCM10010240_40510 [Streptomyces griseoviridis]